MISQRDFIVTLINAGKSTDNIQSLIIDCYGDKAYTMRSIRRIMATIAMGEMTKTTDLDLLLGLALIPMLLSSKNLWMLMEG